MNLTVVKYSEQKSYTQRSDATFAELHRGQRLECNIRLLPASSAPRLAILNQDHPQDHKPDAQTVKPQTCSVRRVPKCLQSQLLVKSSGCIRVANGPTSGIQAFLGLGTHALCSVAVQPLQNGFAHDSAVEQAGGHALPVINELRMGGRSRFICRTSHVTHHKPRHTSPNYDTC